MKKLQTDGGSVVRHYAEGELLPGDYRAYFKGDFNNFTTLPATYQIGSTDTKKEIRKEQLDTARDGWNYAVDEDRVNLFDANGVFTPPSISYSDSFTTDTTARYQAISGTNAFSTDKINLTAVTGNWNKTRLKSYKFESGSYKEKIILPATGHEGDIVCAYFAGSADMATNYGVGVKRLASNLWLPVEIKDNTVITTGTSPVAPIQDGNTVILEIETDMVRGVSWLNVWNETTKNIMTFSGDDYINTGIIPTGDFTIECIFKMNSNGKFIFWNGGYNNVLGICAYVASNGLFNIQFGTGSSTIIVSAGTLSLSVIYKIKIVKSGTIVNTYLNDELKDTKTIDFSINTTQTILLGGYSNPVFYFNGIIYRFKYNATNLYVNTGTAAADWVDRIGTNNGTVSGTPTTVAVTGTKVQATTLKQFAPYQLGYTGIGFYNTGASDNTISLKLLETRARSLIGYTNVPATEQVVFNDDFNVDSRNSYINPTAWEYTIGSGLQNNTNNTIYTKNMYGKQVTEIYFTPSVVDSTPACRPMIIFASQDTLTGIPYNVGNKYIVYLRTENNKVSLMKVVNGTYTVLTSLYDFTFTLGTQYKCKLDFDPSLATDKIKVYVAPAANAYPATPLFTSNDTTYSSGYSGIGNACVYSTGGRLTIQKFNLNGTRLTYKPMLRGAGVGSFYDGTNEMQTARFTDDFNSDNSLNEWTATSGGTITRVGDALNIYHASSSNIIMSKIILPREMVIEFDIMSISGIIWSFYFIAGKLRVEMSSGNLKLYVKPDSSWITLATNTNFTYQSNVWYNVKATRIGNTYKVWINKNWTDTPDINITDSQVTIYDYIGFDNYKATDQPSEYRIKNLKCSYISTNGTLLLGSPEHGGFFLNDGNPVNTGNWAGFKFKNHDRETVYTETLNTGTCPITDVATYYEIYRKNVTDDTIISQMGDINALNIGSPQTKTDTVTLDADDIGDDISLIVRTRSDLAPVLPLLNHSLVRNTLEDTTSNGYYYVDFTVGSDALDIGVWQTGTGSNYFIIDGMLVVPIGLIEKTAKRALVNIAPYTKTIIDAR